MEALLFFLCPIKLILIRAKSNLFQERSRLNIRLNILEATQHLAEFAVLFDNHTCFILFYIQSCLIFVKFQSFRVA